MTLDKLSQLIPFDGTSIMNVSIALLILIICLLYTSPSPRD